MSGGVKVCLICLPNENECRAERGREREGEKEGVREQERKIV